MNINDCKYFEKYAADAKNNHRSLSDHYLCIQCGSSGATKDDGRAYLPGLELLRSYVRPSYEYLVLGCGYGQEIAWLKRQGCNHITGLDIVQDHLDHCEQTYAVRTVKADMRNTGLPDQSYDVVLTCRALHHLFYPFEALEEMGRLARKMTWITSEPVKSDLKSIPRRLLRRPVISSANIYEYQFDVDDVQRYMAFNGFLKSKVCRVWESTPQRAKMCRALNSIMPFFGNRFTGMFERGSSAE